MAKYFLSIGRTALITCAGVGMIFALATLTSASAQQAASEARGPQRFIGGTVNTAFDDQTAADTQSTTSVVNLGGGRLVAAFIDSGSTTVNPNHLTGFAWSNDGGRNWTDGGTLPNSGLGDAFSPSLAYHRGSNVVYLSTATLSGASIRVFKSANNGHSWSAPVDGSRGDPAASHNVGRIAVDNFPGGGNGNVYLCWQASDEVGATTIRFTRSLDGGNVFGPVGGRQLAAAAQGNLLTGCHVTVGKDHIVHVFYYRNAGPNAGLFTRRSLNRGLTFQPQVKVADLVNTRFNGDLNLNGGFQSNTFPQAAVHPGTGRLYVIYNDDTTPASNSDNGDIYLTRSNNGGATWLAPQRINADDRAGDQFFPTIAFAPNGNVMASWYSRGHDPENRVFHRRGQIGTPNSAGLIVWNPSFQLGLDSTVVRDQDDVVSPFYMGEYDLMSAAANGFAVTWSDNSFNNIFHDFQPDVHFALLPTAPNTTNLSLAMTASKTTVALGGTVTFTVDVTALGGFALDPFIASVLPKGLVVETHDGWIGICNTSRFRMFSCRTDRINAGAPNAQHLTFEAYALYQPGTRTFRMHTSTSSDDTTPANNTKAIAINVINGPAVTNSYSTGDISTPIPDLSTIGIPFNVNVSGEGVQVIPQIRLSHDFIGDLKITLVDPNSFGVVLSENNGGFNDGYGSGPTNCAGTRTSFNDMAAVPIKEGSAPFAGNFQPEEPIVGLLRQEVQGTWKLVIEDTVSGDAGVIHCARLIVTRRP